LVHQNRFYHTFSKTSEGSRGSQLSKGNLLFSFTQLFCFWFLLLNLYWLVLIDSWIVLRHHRFSGRSSSQYLGWNGLLWLLRSRPCNGQIQFRYQRRYVPANFFHLDDFLFVRFWLNPNNVWLLYLLAPLLCILRHNCIQKFHQQ